MDLYNRYMLKASGERQFQALSSAEKVTYSVLELLNSRGIGIPGDTELARSQFVSELHDTISIEINQESSSPPLSRIDSLKLFFR
jgi:hypothetical protein